MPENIPIDQIKVGDRFRKDLGDINTLAASIAELGLLQPIVLDEQNRLIAGHRRLEACKILGWTEIPANVLNLKDIVKGEVAENLVRKSFTVSEMVAVKRALEPLEKERAHERQIAGMPAAESDKGRVLEKIAEIMGVSRDSLAKAQDIVRASEENPQAYGPLLEQIDQKRVSLNEAHKRIVEKEHGRTPSLKKFRIANALLDQAIHALQEARDAGDQSVDIWVQGKLVVGVGKEIEIST
jgi:ParB/RepB/Spo0J family partition protein